VRQVPQTQYLIIGSGRLARHLQFYFEQLHISFSAWDRHQDPHLLKTRVTQATHVLLAISDRAIRSFFETHLQGFDLRVVHFSGAFHDDRLISAHPMMSFSDHLFSLETYKKIHFSICGVSHINDALPGLENPYSLILPSQKALYHALCVVSGNFSTLLWQKTWLEFQKLGLPFSAFETYIQQTLQNFIAHPDHSLTGPLVRGDFETMKENHHALPAELKESYLHFAKLYSENTYAQLKKEVSP